MVDTSMQVLYLQCLLGGRHGVRPETAAYLCQRWAPQIHHHELAMRFLILALESYEVDQVMCIIRCSSHGAVVSPQAHALASCHQVNACAG